MSKSSTAGDIDYVLYLIKPGKTLIETSDLTGAADTQIEVYNRTDDQLISKDDDSGVGLGSYLVVASEKEQEVLIVVRNKSLGYGEEVGYTLQIVPEAVFTPTPTGIPTQTPTAIPPTQTPFVITATPEPTQPPAPVSQAPAGPRLTATPALEFISSY